MNKSILNGKLNYLSLEIPWKCWYGNSKFNLDFPINWNVKKFQMEDAQTVSDEVIEDNIQNPINSKQLKHLAKGKKKPIIVIDDLHRPTETYRILPYVVKELEDGGIGLNKIDILISLGAHRPMSRFELVKKIGDRMINTLKVYNHNPYENLTFLGKTSFGTPLSVNTFLYQSDLKILIGSVIPHPYAGFGGGAKLILPGLSGIDTIARNHQPSYGKSSGSIGIIEGNDRRKEIDEAADMVGVDFSINSVSNSEGKTAGLFAGNLRDSYLKAVKFAQKVYSTEVPYNLDIGIFNAFPKDNGIIQSFNSLNVWSIKEDDKQVVKKGGTIVITTSCPDGVGYHGLADKGMRLYIRRDKHATFKDKLNNRNIILFSPNLISRDIYDFLPRNAKLFHKWTEVINKIEENYSNHANIGVFPNSPLQIDRNLIR